MLNINRAVNTSYKFYHGMTGGGVTQRFSRNESTEKVLAMPII